MSEQSTITATDPRVQDIAEFTGETPERVLAEATEAATEANTTVAVELDTAESIIELENAFFADDSDAEYDDDEEDDVDDDDNADMAEYVDC